MKYDENLILSLSRISVSYLWSTRLFYLSLLFSYRRDITMNYDEIVNTIVWAVMVLMLMYLGYLFIEYIIYYATAGVV